MDFSAAPARPTLLYIEDDDAVWKMVHRRLRDRWSLVHAATDIEACVTLRQLGSELSCVMTDLNLAGQPNELDGSLPADKVPLWGRNVVARPSLPIIVITGSELHFNRAEEAGANRVMLKPINFQALEQSLVRLTEGFHRLQGRPSAPTSSPRPSPA
jgi:CheY-like chemotaxis protein